MFSISAKKPAFITSSTIQCLENSSSILSIAIKIFLGLDNLSDSNLRLTSFLDILLNISKLLYFANIFK